MKLGARFIRKNKIATRKLPKVNSQVLEEPEELAGCFQVLLRLPLIGSEALLMFAGGSQQFDLSSQMLRALFVYQTTNVIIISCLF